MVPLRVERAGDDALQIARSLDNAAALATGRPALGDDVWRDLAHGADDSASLVARRGAQPVGFAHVARSDTFSPPHWAIGVVSPDGEDREQVLSELLTAATDHVDAHGNGRAVCWRFEPDVVDDRACSNAGFRPSRDLFQLRVALPLTTTTPWPKRYERRSFDPERDKAAWLVVNNRAFANHPEQGGWIESTLAHRMAEPWFDPTAFLLAFDDVGLAGSNWLKVHPPSGGDPEIGEIFVIGVDPRAQGTGLGRALAVAGLDLLARRGIKVGMLYVDSANTAAVSLYQSLGFTIHRTDRAYEREGAST